MKDSKRSSIAKAAIKLYSILTKKPETKRYANLQQAIIDFRRTLNNVPNFLCNTNIETFAEFFTNYFIKNNSPFSKHTTSLFDDMSIIEQDFNDTKGLSSSNYKPVFYSILEINFGAGIDKNAKAIAILVSFLKGSISGKIKLPKNFAIDKILNNLDITLEDCLAIILEEKDKLLKKNSITQEECNKKITQTEEEIKTLKILSPGDYYTQRLGKLNKETNKIEDAIQIRTETNGEMLNIKIKSLEEAKENKAKNEQRPAEIVEKYNEYYKIISLQLTLEKINSHKPEKNNKTEKLTKKEKDHITDLFTATALIISLNKEGVAENNQFKQCLSKLKALVNIKKYQKYIDERIDIEEERGQNTYFSYVIRHIDKLAKHVTSPITNSASVTTSIPELNGHIEEKKELEEKNVNTLTVPNKRESIKKSPSGIILQIIIDQEEEKEQEEEQEKNEEIALNNEEDITIELPEGFFKRQASSNSLLSPEPSVLIHRDVSHESFALSRDFSHESLLSEILSYEIQKEKEQETLLHDVKSNNTITSSALFGLKSTNSISSTDSNKRLRRENSISSSMFCHEEEEKHPLKRARTGSNLNLFLTEQQQKE